MYTMVCHSSGVWWCLHKKNPPIVSNYETMIKEEEEEDMDRFDALFAIKMKKAGVTRKARIGENPTIILNPNQSLLNRKFCFFLYFSLFNGLTSLFCVCRHCCLWRSWQYSSLYSCQPMDCKWNWRLDGLHRRSWFTPRELFRSSHCSG